MSWLTKVRNALPFAPKRETPDNLWTKCPSCSEMLFTKEYEAIKSRGEKVLGQNMAIATDITNPAQVGPIIHER